MRIGDLDHLRQRTDNEEFKLLIDTEPTCEASNNDTIQWIPARRERKLKDIHAVTYGFECSRCRGFQFVKKRYCSDCGGYFDGDLEIKNKYSERKCKGNFKWQ